MDITCVHVPRVNSETVFQEDLYPVMASISINDSATWFESKESVFVAADSKPAETPSPRKTPSASSRIFIEHTRVSSLAPSTRHELTRSATLKKSQTVSTQSTIPTRQSTLSPTKSVFESEKSQFTSIESLDIMEGQGLLEVKSWFSTSWVPIHISLRRHKLYIQADLSEPPILAIFPETITSLTPQKLAQEGVGLDLEHERKTYRIKLATNALRDSWLAALESRVHLDNDDVSISSKSFKSKTSALLMGSLRVLSNQDPAKIQSWPLKTVVIEEDGIISVYDTEKHYHAGRTPTEFLNLSGVLGLFLVPITGSACPSGAANKLPISIFKLIFEDSHRLFSAKSPSELSSWVQVISKVIEDYDFFPGVESLRLPEAYFHVRVIEKPESNEELSRVSFGTEIILHIFYNQCHYYCSDLDILIEGAFTGDEMDTARVAQTCVDLVLKNGSVIRHECKSSLEAQSLSTALLQLCARSENVLGSKLGIACEADLGVLIQNLNASSPDHVNHLEQNDSPLPMMLSVSNKSQIQVVKPIYTSLTANDSFVLEHDNAIYHWHGPQSSRICRAKALDMATRLRKYRNLRPTIFLVEESEPDLHTKFMKIIGAKGLLKLSENLSMDPCQTVVYKIKSSTRHLQLKMQLVSKSTNPSKRLLESDKAYIICHHNCVYVWIGKASSTPDRLLAKALAKKMAESATQFTALLFLFEEREFPIFQVRITVMHLL